MVSSLLVKPCVFLKSVKAWPALSWPGFFCFELPHSFYDHSCKSFVEAIFSIESADGLLRIACSIVEAEISAKVAVLCPCVNGKELCGVTLHKLIPLNQ